jgi:t-SNARE complex subunit (syntaxin)
MILYYRDPSVSLEEVDARFLQLQDTYRQFEKELNQMKASIKDEINDRTRQNNEEYERQIDEWKVVNMEYNSKWAELRSQFTVWRTNELERISKLKITIPDNLKATFKVIVEVGDASK